MTEIDLPPELATTPVDPSAPLIVVDVDEVLAMFMKGFEQFIGLRGLEMRITAFALFQSIFRPGEDQHLDVETGRTLFDAFFENDPHDIDPTPGSAEALASLSRHAGVLILTNAPGNSRKPRARWLKENGFDYPLIVNRGLKGPAVSALANRTSGPIVFIDDLLPNLESVAADAPRTVRFQLVADERLRPYAPTAPERHQRIDDWPGLHRAIADALGVECAQ